MCARVGLTERTAAVVSTHPNNIVLGARRPHEAALLDYVDFLFLLTGTAVTGTGLPKPAPEMVINLGDPYLLRDGSGSHVFDTAWLTGVSPRPSDVSTNGRTRLLGVRFKPFGARAFFRADLTDVYDRPIALHDLVGRAAADLLDRLHLQADQATSADTRLFDVLETWLVARLGRARLPHRAVIAAAGFIGRRGGIAGVSDAAAIGNVTPQLLRRRFHQEIGVGPKTFGRLIRLSRALALLGDSRLALAHVAVRSGFSDQAHLTHEFRTLTTTTPDEYRRRARGAFSPHFLTRATALDG